MAEGWIKLHRKIRNSQMYRNLNSKQRDVLIQILLLANHEENEWVWGNDIFKCKTGQFVTSLQSLTNRCAKDVKVQSVRTSLLILEKWSFLTNKSTKTGRLITICKWEAYQNEDKPINKEPNKEPTKSQQRANKELTTNKNVKECKECKKNIYKTNVFLTTEEHSNILKDYGISITKSYIDRLNDYIEQIGLNTAQKKYKSHAATIRNWIRRDNVKKVNTEAYKIQEKEKPRTDKPQESMVKDYLNK